MVGQAELAPLCAHRRCCCHIFECVLERLENHVIDAIAREVAFWCAPSHYAKLFAAGCDFDFLDQSLAVLFTSCRSMGKSLPCGTVCFSEV